MPESKPAHTRSLPESKRAFQNAIVRWFSDHAEDYPWRRTHDPYAVLVSELMLQQTQVATVLGRRYFERWLAQFPHLHALANAPVEAVLKAWEGLGYYRRARNLQKAAQAVVEQFDGAFPRSLEGILSLPGVGRYTAGAVASFAYDLPAPLVDANVARVFARLFDFDDPIDSTRGQAQLWAWATQLLPSKNARAYNSGLMELGQKVCTARQPDCNACTVAKFCKTRRPLVLPHKKPRTKTVFLDEHVVFVTDAHRGILLEQETGNRRKGLWKLPAADSRQEQAAILLKLKYSITHHRVTLIVHRESPAPGSPENEHRNWIALQELDALAMPSPYRKALIALLKNEHFTFA